MARNRAVSMFVFAVALLLVTSAGSAASTDGAVTATLKCDQGLTQGGGQVWLLASLPSSFEDMVANNVGNSVLPRCGEAHASFKTKTTITPSGTWAYVHVEFFGSVVESSGRDFLCVAGYPGLGFFSELPIKESCTVPTGETHEPSVTLTLK
jgi:hypothetical protein